MTTITTAAITPEQQALFGAYFSDTPVVGILAMQAGISVEYADGNHCLFSGLLVGYDLELLPDGRINIAQPTKGRPFAWAYRRPIDVKWTVTTIDPATSHTEAWRTARIIQPLYARPT